VKSISVEHVTPDDGLPPSGFVRLPEVLKLIPVSRSTWYQGIAEGRFPAPTKRFGPRLALWSVKDIRALIDKAA
jgi:predicted DNA-binding transcriptional regulator AlpA